MNISPSDPRRAWLHADRALGGDRHHRGPDRPALAGRPGGTRGGAADSVHQQPQADRAGSAQLPRVLEQLPGGISLCLPGGLAQFLAVAVSLVGAGADGTIPGAGQPFQRAQLRFPDRPPADNERCILLAVLSGQHDGDGDRRLPCSSVRATGLPRRRSARARPTTPFAVATASNGGDATNADGAFILGPAKSVASVTDGTSQTAAASEQLLGIAGPYSQTTPTPVPSPWYRAMARVAAAPLTDAGCAVGQRRLAAQQGVELVGRQLPERPL